MDIGDVRLSHERWQDHNRRGLAFAAAADWDEATDAFAAAADSLSNDPVELTPHEPLALVLGNLAQACFRAGRTDEALSHAQRACALRVALTGEDGMPAARARMDFAVMLATAGRRDEAMHLVQRAISAVENHVGEEDPRLTVVLENAARIALSAGAAASAEPFLLRLHALLALHEESTDAADRLLARIAEVRATPYVSPQESRAEPLPVESVEPSAAAAPPAPDASEASPILAISEAPDIVDADISEWDDQPLRDAVALTDVLLRTTPSGMPAIADLSLTDEVAIAPPAAASADTLQPDKEPAAPLVLDFAVHHGLLDDEYLSKASPTPTLELVDVHDVEEPIAAPTPSESLLMSDALTDELGDELVEESIHASPAAPLSEVLEEPMMITAPVSNTPETEGVPALPTRPPRTVSVVLPTPDAGSRAIDTSSLPARRGRKTESVPPSRNEPAKTGSAKVPWVPVGGGLAAVAAAAAWWFFLR